MPINLDLIGHKSEKIKTNITEDKVRDYLNAINSENIIYMDEGVAPPIFNVVQEINILEEIWKMPELHGSIEEMEQNVLMLVHGEQSMIFNRLLKFNEDVYSQAFVDSIVQKGSNYILKLIVVHTDTEGSEIAKSVWTLFIRAAESDIPRDNKPKKPAKKLEKPKLQPEEPINESFFSIDEDVTYRYSKASNDFNPIHIDEETAKKAGLSGIIVHGLCTMAMTMEELMKNNLSSDPSRIKSISLRFSSPVYPGDSLKVKTFKNEEINKLNFEVENQSNIKVIKNGSLIISD